MKVPFFFFFLSAVWNVVYCLPYLKSLSVSISLITDSVWGGLQSTAESFFLMNYPNSCLTAAIYSLGLKYCALVIVSNISHDPFPREVLLQAMSYVYSVSRPILFIFLFSPSKTIFSIFVVGFYPSSVTA